ncbi:hypothetical protein L1887_62108 [Cichorium endivia]|nr:hypothetical protein L1887_62108 [Cichorium endivia]
MRRAEPGVGPRCSTKFMAPLEPLFWSTSSCDPAAAAAASASARTASRRSEFAPKLTLPGPIPAACDTPSGAAAAQRARERLSERTSRRTSGMDGDGIKFGGWLTLALRSRMHLTSSWPHHLWLLSVTASGGHFWKRPAWLLQVPAVRWIQSLVLPPTHSLALPHATLPRPSRARLLCCCSVIRAGLLAPLHLTSPHLLPPFHPPHLNLASTSFALLGRQIYLSSHCRRTVIALSSHCHSQLAFRLAFRLRCTPASSTTYVAIWHTHLDSVLRLASTPSSLSRLVLDSRIPVPTPTSPSSASPASARYAWADIEVAKPAPCHSDPLARLSAIVLGNHSRGFYNLGSHGSAALILSTNGLVTNSRFCIRGLPLPDSYALPAARSREYRSIRGLRGLAGSPHHGTQSNPTHRHSRALWLPPHVRNRRHRARLFRLLLVPISTYLVGRLGPRWPTHSHSFVLRIASNQAAQDQGACLGFRRCQQRRLQRCPVRRQGADQKRALVPTLLHLVFRCRPQRRLEGHGRRLLGFSLSQLHPWLPWREVRLLHLVRTRRRRHIRTTTIAHAHIRRRHPNHSFSCLRPALSQRRQRRSIASDIEDTYRENPHELSVVDHPAWHKLRTQPGVAAPGTLSYLPSLPQKAGLTSDDADLDAMSDAHQPSLASPQRPEFSHPFQQDASSPFFAASAHANGDAARASARPIGKDASAPEQDESLQDVDPGAYDWANFVYAYARGRWNPGLIPQPPGRSNRRPWRQGHRSNTSCTIRNRADPSNLLAMAPAFEPHSLPLSAHGSLDARTEPGEIGSAASFPVGASSAAPPCQLSDTKTPGRSQSLEYSLPAAQNPAASSEDKPIHAASSAGPAQALGAAANDAAIDANVLAALREPSASMSAVTRASRAMAVSTGAHAQNDAENSSDGRDEAHSPHRSKTAPEVLLASVARSDLPSQQDRADAVPASMAPVHSTEKRPSDTVVRTPTKALSDPLDAATPVQQSGTPRALKEGLSPLSTPLAEAPSSESTRTPSKLAQGYASTSPSATRASEARSPDETADNKTEGGAEAPNRPGPTPLQATHGPSAQPLVWQSAPEGLSSFAEVMSRQASAAAAAAGEPKVSYTNDVALENVTVAGLRRAARRTSMERAERAESERTRVDGGRNQKGPLVPHSASFPGSSPRPSFSAAGGPREGVQSLSRLSPAGGPLSSASASASTNNGPTVNVAHFVDGKQSGETRIDLRSTVTSSPPLPAKESEEMVGTASALHDVSEKDVSLAANASTGPRPGITSTASQRIQSYLAAGRRAELFYRDHGYLPSILPPHEESRLHALARYGPPKIAGNPNFERIAHLVKLVFNSKLVLITLDGDEPIVIFDAAKDWRFSGNPLVKGSPDIRFYAGSPLRTSDGLNIGALCLIDDKPRTQFGPRQRHTLKEFARVVMREMELLRDKIQFSMRDRMQRSVELFTKECLEMDSEEGDMREALQASGAVIFDLSHFELIDSYDNDFLPSDLGTGTSSKIYFANPLSSQDPGVAASGANSGDVSGSNSDVAGSPGNVGTSLGRSGTISGKKSARERHFDGTTGVEAFGSSFSSPVGEQHARAKRVPPMNVLGASEADTSPDRSEFVPLSHHVQMAEFLRVHRTGKFYSYAPPPFRSLLPHGVTGLLLVPIFGLNKQPFALLCAYITSSERSIALEELQVSGLQYLRALGMIVLSAILKKDIMLADKAKSNFISNISHELRTPLHGILAAAELLAETKLNSTQGSYLETVEACGKSLLELVNHVLDFTKLSGNTRQGQRSVQTKTKCDMVKLIQEVCESSWIGQMARQVETFTSGIGSVYAPPSDGGSGDSLIQARARVARENRSRP